MTSTAGEFLVIMYGKRKRIRLRELAYDSFMNDEQVNVTHTHFLKGK